MNEASPKAKDYSQTLFLPKTDFPMRAGLPQKEPEILARWTREALYGRLRAKARGRVKFVLHDGPPYANGNIHIGHALNKILKDMVVRSQQMAGKDSNYVPGWDCHGLPIEWKIEEENYRAKGETKPNLSDPAAMIAFRKECRAYAERWISVQREEFKRLGVVGDWDHPYSTMSFAAEAQIAREIMKFAKRGLLYRGSKPVMWSVVEKTALAEAEVEYEDYVSDQVWVKFPLGGSLEGPDHLSPGQQASGDEYASELPSGCAVLIWTTTPWTIPGNRAVAFSRNISYGLYRVKNAPAGNWAAAGDVFILADGLADEVLRRAKVAEYERLGRVSEQALRQSFLRHPLYRTLSGYDFLVPLLPAEHVTGDAGTGFVHTAPGHGREDFELWTSVETQQLLKRRNIDPAIPYTVDENGAFTKDAPGFEAKRVLTDKGEKGDANEAVIQALIAAGALIARGRLTHQYPHSWRSKKPVIFRNTPQWFVAMDKPIDGGPSLRETALKAIQDAIWVPASGENRINGMVVNKPDWVMSRQRAWGVPIAFFVRKGENAPLVDDRVNRRIADAFEQEGADAWYAEGAAARFLTPDHDPNDFEKVDDILDVWFDSGSTHAFTFEDPVHFPALADVKRVIDGGADEVMYLEGSDQHRGWFQSSLLESCATRGRAPFDFVLTHGFTLDENGRKMSKSLGNQTFPQDVIKQSGADILRLWAASVDYSDDQRIGPEILKSVGDNYRKLRNTIRWMLGALAHHSAKDAGASQPMAEIDLLMLHRLCEIDEETRKAYADFDYARVVSQLSAFMNTDLSAFYFDIRKDSLYCDPISSAKRLGALAAIEQIFRCATIWLAPILVFTCEEAWASRYPEAPSIHLEQFPTIPRSWRNAELAERWTRIRRLRSVVTGAIEIVRAAKEIGSSLEASPRVFIEDPALADALEGVDFAEVCITSDIAVIRGPAPEGAFRLAETPGVGVVVERAAGVKCARSWRYFDPKTADPDFPDVTPRDAKALRELKAASDLE
jgi:isoleucyl-tRNA synthetase